MAWYTWAGWALRALSIGYGLLFGGAPERIASLMIAAASLATVCSRNEWVNRYLWVERGPMISDMALVLGLAGVALTARRKWPILITACAALTALGHVGRALDVHASNTAYMLLSVFSAYTMPFVLISGTYRHQQRLRRMGADPSWNASWLADWTIPASSPHS